MIRRAQLEYACVIRHARAFLVVYTTEMSLCTHCVLGCGSNIAGCSNNRVLKNKSSEEVVNIWQYIYEELLRASPGGAHTIVTAGGKMCRKCFNSYERCAKLISTLKSNAETAAEVLALSVECNNDQSSFTAPAPKRIAVSASGGASSSPDVLVRYREQFSIQNCHLEH